MILRRRTRAGTVRYGVRVDRGGRQVWVGTFDTLAEARRQERKARDRRTFGQMSADRYVEHYLEDYATRRKRSSLDAARTALRGFAADFRGIPMEKITVVEAQRWARANRWRIPAVVALFNAAIKAELVERNPFAGLSRKGPGRKNTAPLTVAEVERLGQCALEAHGDYGPQMRSLILFLAYSALRVGEAFSLEWTDLDFETMRIKVERRAYRGEVDLPKSNKRRTVVLTPQAADALEPLTREERRVFSGKRGGPLSQSLLTWYWQPVEARFGRKVDPHELRHFAGHWLYVTLGLPSRVVAVQLGHEGPQLVEDLYGHGDVGALEAIDEAVQDNVIPMRRRSHGR